MALIRTTLIFTFSFISFLASAQAKEDKQLILEPLSCSKELGVRSQSGKVEAGINFLNGTQDTVIVQWINYDGYRDTTGNHTTRIEKNMSARKRTYLTHPFVVTKLNGECLGIYIPQAKDNVVFIE